jgi:cyclopropane fatty-acyl-phospholipid synthase-like methyltransferase
MTNPDKTELPRVHDHKVGTYFDKAAVAFDTFYDHKRSRLMQWVDKKFRSDIFIRYQMVFEVLNHMQDKTVLDIGCGSGPYVIEAARRGCRKVTGLDMAAGMLEISRQKVIAKKYSDKCLLILGTFPEDAPAEKYDYAIAMGVMDYIADPQSFLNILARCITEKAVLSFPSKHWFRTPFRRFRYWLKNCPLYFYDADQLNTLMRTAGFAQVKIEKISGAGMDYVVTGTK